MTQSEQSEWLKAATFMNIMSINSLGDKIITFFSILPIDPPGKQLLCYGNYECFLWADVRHSANRPKLHLSCFFFGKMPMDLTQFVQENICQGIFRLQHRKSSTTLVCVSLCNPQNTRIYIFNYFMSWTLSKTNTQFPSGTRPISLANNPTHPGVMLQIPKHPDFGGDCKKQNTEKMQ